MIEFVWDTQYKIRPFNEDAYRQYRSLASSFTPERSRIDDNEFLGCVRVGDLAFDLRTKFAAGDILSLYFKFYVGGVEAYDAGAVTVYHSDAPYCYPYSYAGDGGFWYDDLMFPEIASDSEAYAKFKEIAEMDFLSYIAQHPKCEEYGLMKKLYSQLHIW